MSKCLPHVCQYHGDQKRMLVPESTGGMTGSPELLDVGAGSQTQVLWKHTQQAFLTPEPPLQSGICFLLHLFIDYVECAHRTHGDQMTALRSQVFPFTVWVPGIKRGLSGSMASPKHLQLLTPLHQSPDCFLLNSFCP